jgi:hypothetical protein
MLDDEVLDRIATGPSGQAIAFGEPVTIREAADLFEDLDSRTLYSEKIVLPSGTPALVRTLCLILDDDAATRADLGAGHVPQFASACYWGGADLRECVVPLWTYGSSAEAKAGHREAVEEFRSGRARVAA